MRPAHRLTSSWQPSAQTFLPAARGAEREGGTEFSRGLSSAGGSSRHVTLLGGLRLPPSPFSETRPPHPSPTPEPR